MASILDSSLFKRLIALTALGWLGIGCGTPDDTDLADTAETEDTSVDTDDTDVGDTDIEDTDIEDTDANALPNLEISQAEFLDDDGYWGAGETGTFRVHLTNHDDEGFFDYPAIRFSTDAPATVGYEDMSSGESSQDWIFFGVDGNSTNQADLQVFTEGMNPGDTVTVRASVYLSTLDIELENPVILEFELL